MLIKTDEDFYLYVRVTMELEPEQMNATTLAITGEEYYALPVRRYTSVPRGQARTGEMITLYLPARLSIPKDTYLKVTDKVWVSQEVAFMKSKSGGKPARLRTRVFVPAMAQIEAWEGPLVEA